MHELTKDALRKMLLEKKGKFKIKLTTAEKMFREEIKKDNDGIPMKSHQGDSCNCFTPSINGKRIITLRKCLEKFNEALIKVDEGTYGICEDCKEQIPLGRLALIPFAQKCVPCKNLSNGQVSAISREPAH